MEEERVVFARRADDMHHHLRDGDALSVTVPAAARQFQRVIAMPNLTPPITTTEMALAYRERILSQVPIQYKDSFTPLMTLYMTDETTCDEIRKAHDSKCIHAVKYYPAGATTNSAHGVTDMKYIYDVLHVMTEIGMPLLIHGEVTDNNIDIFDREATCISTVLQPLVLLFPDLKIVMEHITTSEGVAFVQNTNNVAATITPQHLLYNRNGKTGCIVSISVLISYSPIPRWSSSPQVLSSCLEARESSVSISCCYSKWILKILFRYR